ncbi:MAG: creatininase family protein, partial [Candidatus Hodarchaeota archaeon]
ILFSNERSQIIGGKLMQTIRIEEMNWPDIKEAINQGFTTVVFGIGSNEQHGPHLPTKTDTLIGDAIANKFALKFKNTLQAPTINVGCSDHHISFAGTISYRSETLKAIIFDFVESLIKHGFKTIVLIPSHGGNFQITQQAIEELQQKHPELKIVGYTDLFGLLEILSQLSADFGVSKAEAGAHAGESEASFMLSLSEDLVKKDRFVPGFVGEIGAEETQTIFEKGMPALTDNGILGDPRTATKEKGAHYLEKIVDVLIEEIQKQLL